MNLARRGKETTMKKNKIRYLSFRELKSYFDKKFEDINEKFSVETKQLAKRIKNLAVPSFNYKDNRIQHDFNLNLRRDMEVLIHLIQKGSISRATKAVKNMIEDLQKRIKLIKLRTNLRQGRTQFKNIYLTI